jgi:hypothetical protein
LQWGHQLLAGLASSSIAITLQHSAQSPQVLLADDPSITGVARFSDAASPVGKAVNETRELQNVICK